MRRMMNAFKIVLLAAVLGTTSAADAFDPTGQTKNQTAELSPIRLNRDLPFRICIELDKDQNCNNFLLPNGVQGYALGRFEGKWLILDGRTNGLHGFSDTQENFPPQKQNRVVYVVDPDRKQVFFRSLDEPDSGLTQDQIDSLSVTSPEYDQVGSTLYITGGYGFRNSINDFTTFDVLTAIDIPGLIQWVIGRPTGETASQHIRQISDPIFQITGGDMHKLGKNKPTLLVLGHDFEGEYFQGVAIQVYSEQVRRFHILDDGVNLSVQILPSKPLLPDPNFRRRDLNIVPVISKDAHGKLVPALVALSGVFTPSTGIWTVPVQITADGDATMADPTDPCTFKQGLNNYVCPTAGLYSKKTGDMYTILFGGISYGFIQNGTFQVDAEIPFINQVTTVKIDKCGIFSQYLMDNEYPVIRSTASNPGNVLLFGANGTFIPANGLDNIQYDNHVFKLDRIKKPLLIGYIVGGIQSTVPNTDKITDSAASPYIFKVILEPK